MPVYPASENPKNDFVLPQKQGWDTPPTPGVNPAPEKEAPGIIDALAPLPKFKEVQGYNPFKIPGEITGYEMFATKFSDSRSPEETIAIKQQIDAQKSVFGVESASGFNTLMTTGTVGIIILIILSTLLYRRLRK
ncbi:hypothetical protein [Serratia fonticola]